LFVDDVDISLSLQRTFTTNCRLSDKPGLSVVNSVLLGVPTDLESRGKVLRKFCWCSGKNSMYYETERLLL